MLFGMKPLFQLSYKILAQYGNAANQQPKGHAAHNDHSPAAGAVVKAQAQRCADKADMQKPWEFFKG